MMIVRVILYRSFVFSILVSCFASCSQDPTCASLRERPASLLQNLRYKEDTILLLNNLNKVLETDSFCLKALQLRGFLYMASGQYASAKRDFARAYLRDTVSSFSSYYLGMVYNFEGKNNDALFFLNKAKTAKDGEGYVISKNRRLSYDVDVEYEEIIHYIGIVFFELEMYSEAKREFRFCIEKKYFGYDTFGYLAAIYNEEDKKDSACYFHAKAMKGGRSYCFDSTLYQVCR